MKGNAVESLQCLCAPVPQGAHLDYEPLKLSHMP